MSDYQIQPNARRCAQSGRELRPGDRYFSVLTEENGRFIRRDYGAETWTGAPHGSFGHWAGRIATGETKQRPPIDDQLLLDCLTRLEGQTEPSRLNFRYVLALLLMRRRRLRFEDSERDGEREVLVLRDPKSGARHRVVNPALSDAETAAVQDEVLQTIGWE